MTRSESHAIAKIITMAFRDVTSNSEHITNLLNKTFPMFVWHYDNAEGYFYSQPQDIERFVKAETEWRPISGTPVGEIGE